MKIETQCVDDCGPWTMDGPIDGQELIEPKPARGDADTSQKNRAGKDRHNGPLGRRNAKRRRTALHTERLLAGASRSICALQGASMQACRGPAPFFTFANSWCDQEAYNREFLRASDPTGTRIFFDDREPPRRAQRQ